MDRTQHEDNDDLSALDFSGHGGGADHHDDADALDFSAPAGHEDSDADALTQYVPAEPEPSGAELEALAEEPPATPTEDEVLDPFTFTVTNPEATVSVSALMDGRIRGVELSPKVTAMTEGELTNEILVLAELATQKALAGQHTFIMENGSLMENDWAPEGFRTLDPHLLREFVEDAMGLPRPEYVQRAEAEVFAERYGNEDR